ncbi:hypothetical protein [Emergencia sp. 1XD21-10]|uniref:hypothetical protein n=1 Tax=Emergencia sp. 1XD21-10 TaxID=2304569 RepID=UPI0013795DA9|nr:hypothetical protein [Emergencia sp. 1XD21-10]NCE98192.1 hypothetical protein [Emergencia sp. 1XD21-10]
MLEMKFSLYYDDDNEETCYDMFSGEEDFTDEKEIKGFIKTVIKDMAGLTRGRHFSLYVNRENEAAVNWIKEYCIENGIGMTLLYPDEAGGWREEELQLPL